MDWSQPSFQPISPGPFEISSPENTFNQSLSYSSPEQHSAAHGVWPSFTDSPNSSSQLASPPLQCSHTSYRESPQHCYIMCNNFLSPDQVHQRALLQHCLQSRWLNADELEPSDAPRRSILLGFLAQNTPKAAFSCEFDGCGKKFDRQDRALGHIRMHLCHRPYACNLQCGNSSCVERFSCRSYLQSHLTRQKEKCRKWFVLPICIRNSLLPSSCSGQSFLRQNMRRHNGTCPGSSLL
jgi:hypothetical protein